MPAIQPARLKHEAAHLAALAPQPAAFLRALEDLLEFYADRTRRHGQSGAPAPLMPAYHVALPVLREILRAVDLAIGEDIHAGLALADALWAAPHLEGRLLAARVLGLVPPTPPEPVLDRVLAWAQACEEDQVLHELLNASPARVRATNPELFLPRLRVWLRDGKVKTQILGLRAVYALLQEPGFDNLPAIFDLLGPFTSDFSPDLRPYLRDIYRELAERSPQETAYVLRQALLVARDSSTAWLVRQTLPALPPASQAALREEVSLRKKG